MLLALSTATDHCAVALIKDKKTIQATSWLSKANESEKLLLMIGRLLKKAKTTFSQLTEILVVSGPGSYTRLRIGIATANALAFTLKIPLKSIDTFTLFALRQTQPKFPLMVLLKAGFGHVYEKTYPPKLSLNKIHTSPSPIYFYTTEDLQTKLNTSGKDIYIIADISPEQKKLLQKNAQKRFRWIEKKDLLTLAETVVRLPLSSLPTVTTIKPFYVRPPTITASKKF